MAVSMISSADILLQVTNQLNAKDNYSYFFLLVLRLDCSFSKARLAQRFTRKGLYFISANSSSSLGTSLCLNSSFLKPQ
jgi:hypothetical protein